ncbi:hypothetical protein Pmani_007719 [Petrolisthes manimaculis]|uniref:GH18 domain-containing protein n=1 Tax=Petrolisthes manimaculis TaxID=1843537 RepID=A0AAE1QA24_9EUCA|nr:hypothetical protein Pmani_007719 [Petrolisthes manimaculis]
MADVSMENKWWWWWVVTCVAAVVGVGMGPFSLACENYKMVCYYSSWANYRPNEGRYTIQDIPVEQCTHLIYAFALLDSNSLTIKSGDPFFDTAMGHNNYGAFVNLRSRNPQAKFLLGLGGWTDSHSDKYSRLVSESHLRSTFIKHVVSFLIDHNFEGLDLDWEFPGYGDRTQDKQGFLLWVQELRAAFEPHGLLLTAAVSAEKDDIDRGYDVAAMSEALHQIHLMTYDRYKPSQTSNHAPLFQTPGSNPHFAVDFTVQYYLEKGAPPEKLVLGVPLYGRSFILAGSDRGVGAETSGPGSPGPLMQISGSLAYYEVCRHEKEEGWTKVSAADGPHLTNGVEWVGYDDVEAVTKKAQYVRERGLGGIMVWDIATDDFLDLCGKGVNPLISAAERTLCGLKLGLAPTWTSVQKVMPSV